MLDIKTIENEPDKTKKNLKKRGINPYVIDELLSLNDQRKTLITVTDKLKNERNIISKEFGKRKKAGEDVSELLTKMSDIKEELEVKDHDLTKIKNEVQQQLLSIPNILADEVPLGKDDSENIEIKKWGTPKNFSFKPLAHWDLGEKLNMLDLKTGAKLTGSRFFVMNHAGALLDRALTNFFLDFYSERSYTEISTPYLVNSKTLTGTGQLPKFEDDLFKIEDSDYYLIPTAEVPVTNIYANEILDEVNLPLYYACATPCFRKEAGSYGKDTRGIIRVHQFNKVELVKFVPAEDSIDEHEHLLRDITDSLEVLGLPYRVVLLCSGDTGFSAHKCYDVEVWLPSENKYREISSISNFGDYQARRANIKYKNSEGKKEFAHTLNGSGLAIGRTMVAIMENFQNEDGSITIPEVLIPYMNGIEKIGGEQ